jgi:hypothetical protein
MNIPIKYKPMVKMLDKDIEMKGYNIILNDGYRFIDDSQIEYVESQEELKNFLSMVKPYKAINDEVIKDLLKDNGIDYTAFDNNQAYGFIFKIKTSKFSNDQYEIVRLKDVNHPDYNDYTIKGVYDDLDLNQSTIDQLKEYLRLK